MVKNPFIYVKKILTWLYGCLNVLFLSGRRDGQSCLLEFVPGQPACSDTRSVVYSHNKITALQKENEVTCRRIYGLVRLQDRVRCLPNSGCCCHAVYHFPCTERLSGMLAWKAAFCILCKICSHRRRFVVAPGVRLASWFTAY